MSRYPKTIISADLSKVFVSLGSPLARILLTDNEGG